MADPLTSPNVPTAPAVSNDPIAADPHHPHAAATALWLFMGVASTLFTLFIVAYAMRMDAADWSAITLPWQLWLSTGALLAAGALMQRAGSAAALGQARLASGLMFGAGGATAVFLASQLWGWQSLIDARVLLSGNPAASFFYVLTALHGLHVIGGLVAWSVAAQSLALPAKELPAVAWRLQLCARYWHFLLVVWVALFAALSGLTPEFVRMICGK